ncbi:hypothetical protein C8046_10490 [Serinibacter arcticus]|uniref:Tetracyclin repressor-like C-terminal group 31 domain-containing protein n=1 Tax=Serinibacter arcticus TaxID=1655435 RepID=A0A2U1ZVP4_9MICO|nr:hypothetical protein [Serinibacter arcticus]PWD51013.1 hypothetical protein C8046_10490 [Serinibacter arcticus]
MPRPPSDRPARIADASLEIIATSGLHALTHRTIDARLGFPAGTTSYYARTRAELVNRALTALIERFDEATLDFPIDEITTDEQAVTAVTTVTAVLTSQVTDQIARYVLLIDLRDDPELHPLINATSRVQQRVTTLVADLLEQVGIPDPKVHALGLTALIDGLVLAKLAGGSPVSIEDAIRVYWAGLPRS